MWLGTGLSCVIRETERRSKPYRHSLFLDGVCACDFPPERSLEVSARIIASRDARLRVGVFPHAFPKPVRASRANAVHGWLRRLFETTLLDHYRQSARLRIKTTPLDQQSPPVGEIIVQPMINDDRETIDDVLKRLRPGYAQIIRLMDLGSDEPSTVAARLCISPNNLAVRLHRARNAFRAALADMPVVLQD